MINVKLVFGFTITLLYVKHSASLQYVPADREVEVVQAGTYRIGIEDAVDLDIARCNFTSDTGLDCSFEIWPTRAIGDANPIYCNYNNGLTYEYENTVTDHGREGLCQITVNMVQHTGPTNWTLTAEDLSQEVLVNNTFKIHFFYGANLAVINGIRVQESAHFVNHMTGFAFDDLVSCNVRYNDTIIELDLRSTRTSTHLAPYSEESEEISERLSSLGVGLCGFKYANATSILQQLEWTLTAIDKDGLGYRRSFKTNVKPKPIPGNMHSKRDVVWGSAVLVPCGSSPVSSHLCSIFNPRGELVESRKCQYNIISFSMNDVGVWKCYAGSEFAMESLEYTMTFLGKNPQTIEAWNYETDSYLTMGCKTVNVKGFNKYCKMIAPNQRLLMLSPSMAADRYLSLGTDVMGGICSLQIKKPLQEFEKGRWLCEIGGDYQDPTGSAIVVGAAEAADYPKYTKLTTQLEDTFTINCVVPYFTEYCRIQAPNGTQYNSLSENQIRLGRCSITIDNVTASDNGTWVCFFGKKTGEPDDEIVTEVTVAEVLQYYKFVEVDSEDSAELICSSGGLALRYCRFISPSGKGYQIHDHKNSSTISYYGRGLAYGDCGIKISKTQLTDNGYWTCETEIISSKYPSQISARILLDVSETGPNFAAIGIGTAVGVVLVGSIVGMVLIRKWRRRRHDEFPGIATAERGINTDDTLSEHSQNSESNIFSMETIARSYTRNDGTLELERL